MATQTTGQDFTYIDGAWIAAEPANMARTDKNGFVSDGTEDIVYFNLFTGLRDNCLRSSIFVAGLAGFTPEQ